MMAKEEAAEQRLLRVGGERKGGRRWRKGGKASFGTKVFMGFSGKTLISHLLLKIYLD
jgi:hypothetical protein